MLVCLLYDSLLLLCCVYLVGFNTASFLHFMFSGEILCCMCVLLQCYKTYTKDFIKKCKSLTVLGLMFISQMTEHRLIYRGAFKLKWRASQDKNFTMKYTSHLWGCFKIIQSAVLLAHTHTHFIMSLRGSAYVHVCSQKSMFWLPSISADTGDTI